MLLQIHLVGGELTTQMPPTCIILTPPKELPAHWVAFSPAVAVSSVRTSAMEKDACSGSDVACALPVCEDSDDDTVEGRPIYVVPLTEVFPIMDTDTDASLDVIDQENRKCFLYEKLGIPNPENLDASEETLEYAMRTLQVDDETLDSSMHALKLDDDGDTSKSGKQPDNVIIRKYDQDRELLLNDNLESLKHTKKISSEFAKLAGIVVDDAITTAEPSQEVAPNVEHELFPCMQQWTYKSDSILGDPSFIVGRRAYPPSSNTDIYLHDIIEKTTTLTRAVCGLYVAYDRNNVVLMHAWVRGTGYREPLGRDEMEAGDIQFSTLGEEETLLATLPATSSYLEVVMVFRRLLRRAPGAFTPKIQRSAVRDITGCVGLLQHNHSAITNAKKVSPK